MKRKYNSQNDLKHKGCFGQQHHSRVFSGPSRTERTFEEWEKLPSDIKLTRGECNQLYNILTGDVLDLDAIDVESIINKLTKEI